MTLTQYFDSILIQSRQSALLPMKFQVSVVLTVKEFAVNLSEIVQDLLKIVIQGAFVNKATFAVKRVNASS